MGNGRLAAAGFLAPHLRGGLRHQAADGLIFRRNADLACGAGLGRGRIPFGLRFGLGGDLRFGRGLRRGVLGLGCHGCSTKFGLKGGEFRLKGGLGLIRKCALGCGGGGFILDLRGRSGRCSRCCGRLAAEADDAGAGAGGCGLVRGKGGRGCLGQSGAVFGRLIGRLDQRRRDVQVGVSFGGLFRSRGGFGRFDGFGRFEGFGQGLERQILIFVQILGRGGISGL